MSATFENVPHFRSGGEPLPVGERPHSHYHKDVSHLKSIDVYRVLKLFDVTDPCLQHAIKKLLVAGKRGSKGLERDLREACDSIDRALQMIAEDANHVV